MSENLHGGLLSNRTGGLDEEENRRQSYTKSRVVNRFELFKILENKRGNKGCTLDTVCSGPKTEVLQNIGV